MIQPDGSFRRILRSVVLGPLAEIPTRRAARLLLLKHVSDLNTGESRPEGTITFGSFVAEQFDKAILPTLKYET